MMMTAVIRNTKNLDSLTRPAPRAPAMLDGLGELPDIDPLADDHQNDDIVITTRRGISRVALVAAMAGGRFERDGAVQDPMAWMLAPRLLFAGEAALDACLDRDACLRGILLHSLSLGLDANPVVIDELTQDDEGDYLDDIDFSGFEFERSPFDHCSGDGHAAIAEPGMPEQRGSSQRLFTATLVVTDGVGTMQAFHASLATCDADIAGRLSLRFGFAASDAVIVEGFDPTEPLVGALVSKAICDTLTLIASDPGSLLAAGIDLNVEQRFLA